MCFFTTQSRCHCWRIRLAWRLRSPAAPCPSCSRCSPPGSRDDAERSSGGACCAPRNILESSRREGGRDLASVWGRRRREVDAYLLLRCKSTEAPSSPQNIMEFFLCSSHIEKLILFKKCSLKSSLGNQKSLASLWSYIYTHCEPLYLKGQFTLKWKFCH